MKRIISMTSAALFALPFAALADDGTFVSGGVPLHYTDEGTGPAVVTLHAFAGSSALWESNGFMPLDGFRVINFDARGHGDSGKPTASDAYGNQLVQDVIRIMDDRGVETAHIVGYSMGAETALKLATTHPDRVLSLVVAGSGWSREDEAQTYGFISEALGGVATFGDFMAAMAPDDTGTSEEDMRTGFAMLAAHGIAPDQDAAPLAATSGAMHEVIGLSAAELSAIEVPVLGIAGETDEERTSVARLGEAIPDFSFVLIPDADHLSAPLAPFFTETVYAFLKD